MSRSYNLITTHCHDVFYEVNPEASLKQTHKTQEKLRSLFL